MSDYGTHPTRYTNLNDDVLYSMYRESVYNTLNEDEKLDLLQETVNRDALERGEVGTPLVQFADLPSDEAGNAANGVIQINYDMAVNGVQMTKYDEWVISYSIDDYNIQALNTAIHENVHCFQNQVIDGTISIKDKHITAEYRANDFTQNILWQNGHLQIGSQYLTGETPGGYYMYYFQAKERDAHLTAEKKTGAILQRITAQYGSEPSFQAYERSIEAKGYQATEQEAVRLFQNENFVEDLNQTLQNYYYGTSIPVDAATESAVKTEMIESYRHMQEQLDEENRACIYQAQDPSVQADVDNISEQTSDDLYCNDVGFSENDVYISTDNDNSAAVADNGIESDCEDSLDI